MTEDEHPFEVGDRVRATIPHPDEKDREYDEGEEEAREVQRLDHERFDGRTGEIVERVGTGYGQYRIEFDDPGNELDENPPSLIFPEWDLEPE